MDSSKLNMIFFSVAPILFFILGTIIYKLNVNPSIMIVFGILYLFLYALIDIKLDE